MASGGKVWPASSAFWIDMVHANSRFFDFPLLTDPPLSLDDHCLLPPSSLTHYFPKENRELMRRSGLKVYARATFVTFCLSRETLHGNRVASASASAWSISILFFPLKCIGAAWAWLTSFLLRWASLLLLTIVDDYTRCTWLYLMKNKFETCSFLESFLYLVETQHHTKIQVLRSDNGLGFNMPFFFSSKGVIHQTSCTYTPKKNKVVECKHQHLLNVARALRFQSNIPLTFWDVCVMIATYLIN